MSSEDFTYGFNQGLIAGLTQRPFAFGLGVPNKRKAFEVVLNVPEDNLEVSLSNPCGERGFTGGINWGDGTVEKYISGNDCLNLIHTYPTAGSFKMTIESDFINFARGINYNSPTKNYITQVSIPALPNGITYSEFGLSLPNLVHVTLAEGLTYCYGRTVSGYGTSCYGAFANCPLIETIVIPSTLNDAMCLFANCSGLKFVYLTHGLKTIKSYMFYRCSKLETLIIPNTVTNIGYQAFGGCSALKEATYEGTMEEWNTVKLDRGQLVGAFDSGVVIHCTDGDVTI